MIGWSYIDGAHEPQFAMVPTTPLVLIPYTEGKDQLLCIIIFELLFLLHPHHFPMLEDHVEQGFSLLGRH